MKDIESPRLMYFKAGLLLFLGLLSSALLILEHTSLRTAFLLAVAIWAFARAYYFAFYVIEHYIDSDFQFAGLTSFVSYVWNRRRDHTADTCRPPAQTPASPAKHDTEDA